MSRYSKRRIRQILVGENGTLTFRFHGGQNIEAKALEIETDDNGELVSAVLDRIIHEGDEEEIRLPGVDDINRHLFAHGCIASEISIISDGNTD